MKLTLKYAKIRLYHVLPMGLPGILLPRTIENSALANLEPGAHKRKERSAAL